MHLTSSDLIISIIIQLIQIVSFTNAIKGKYTVIAPGTIHSNEKYTAAVAIHHTIHPCQIKIGIISPFYNITKQVLVTNNEIKHVEFMLPHLRNDNYNITAEGIDCLDNFRTTTTLIYENFRNHVIVQTDKYRYEPGDIINFRVLYLDKDYRPSKPERNAVIWFSDGKHNRIKEIKNFKTIMGVYTGKFKISEYSVTGNWHLGVKNGRNYDHKILFQVEKYILPKILVKVEATEKVSIKDGGVHIIAMANYTYGKPLSGKVTVFITCLNNESKEPLAVVRVVEMVKGKAKIDFNITDYTEYLIKRNPLSYMSLAVMVEERFTGVTVNISKIITIYPYRYFIDCKDYYAFDNNKVDTEEDVLFHITHVNGSYLNDTKSNIKLIYKEFLRKSQCWYDNRKIDDNISKFTTPPLSQNRTFTFMGHMNTTGYATFRVKLPFLPKYEGYLHYYYLEMIYLDEQHEICSTHKIWNLKQCEYLKTQKEETLMEYFILEPKIWSSKLDLNKPNRFLLNSSQPLSYFDYIVIGRGNILKSGRIELPENRKLYNLTLTPEFLWAPRFSLYVDYVDEAGKYYYAEQKYEVVFELENQINIIADNQVKPGDEVTLKIQTTPNSFVGLMAVDQKMMQLGFNDNLDYYRISAVLDSYNTYAPYRYGYLNYPGQRSGCVTLTNADYFFSETIQNNVKDHKILRKRSIDYQSVPGRDYAHNKNLQISKEFSETWFFDNIENTETAKISLTKKIPETITSWALTAFSVNFEKGLGVTWKPIKITTLRPFLISIRLPYSVQRGEVINVPAMVFNYLETDLDIKLFLHNTNDEYEFIEFDKTVINVWQRSKSIHVPANEAAGVAFLIKPKVVGMITLKFTAISPKANDTIHESMKVIDEGVTQYINRAHFLHLKKQLEIKTSFVLELPKNFVSDSEHNEIEVMGDILGPVLNNLNNLIRLPTGCGEQTMSLVMLNYLIMKYLRDSERLTPALEFKLHSNLETGYQNIIKYRHLDGSFSSFGGYQVNGKPNNGSTWLTAYVIRSLLQMKEIVYVNEKVIKDGLKYLMKQQATNGKFIEKDDYFFTSQRNHVTLTSNVVLTLLENADYAKEYLKELNNGLEFVAQNIDKSTFLHAQAIGTFTLNKIKHVKTNSEILKLKSLAKTEADFMWWSAENSTLDHRRSNTTVSDDVEITSYILMALLDQESFEFVDVLPIIKWLVAQRNSYGGFASTQDTVVALTALIKLTKLTNYIPAEMNVHVKSNDKDETLILSKNNGIFFQKIQMPPKTKIVEFTVNGSGSALLQISQQYNTFENRLQQSFSIKTNKTCNKNHPFYLKMLVCVTYMGKGDFTNMAVLEISTPSGYVVDNENLEKIKKSNRVGNIEVKNFDSLLIVYFDHLFKHDETCLQFEALRTYAVAMQKPAAIILYDYYDIRKKSITFYTVESKLCDICETDEDCNRCKQ